MSLLTRFVNLWRRRSLDREFDEELRFHLEMRTEKNLRAGMSTADAEAEARRHLGGVLRAREGMRDARVLIWLDELGRDLRQGARMFARQPGPTCLAILTLSLGIGANTVIFSLVYAVMFRPLPLPAADRLVAIVDGFRTSGVSGLGPTVPEWIDVRSATRRFDGLSFYDTRDVQINGGTEPARAYAARVEASFFTVLGVRPALGRGFVEGENLPGREQVALLSDGLWRRTFGADPAIVGSSIIVNGAATTVIGVLPAGFSFDYMAPEPIALFVPFSMSPLYTLRTGDFANIRRVTAIGRLAGGETIAGAASDLRAAAQQIAIAHPELYRRGSDGQDLGFFIDAVPLQAAIAARSRPILFLLFGAVGLVLLVACVNTAQFLLARALERTPEVAIRIALGAGRARLVRQFLAEALMLATVGAAAGLVQAAWLHDVLLAILPARPAGITPAAIDGPVLAFAILLTLLSTIVFGLIPAVQFSRNTSLRRVERHGIVSGRTWSRQALIALEVGVSIVLLVAAALLVQSLRHLQNAPGGYTADGVTMIRMRAAAGGTGVTSTGTLYQRYLERIAGIPGVLSAAIADGPLAGSAGVEFVIGGREHDPAALSQQVASYRIVSPHYFSTLRIPLRQGRVFAEHDTVARPRVAIINEDMARRYWPGQDPIGQTISAGAGPRAATMTVVGVVGDVRPVLQTEASPQIYVSYLQQSEPNITLLVRAAPGAAVLPAVKQAVWSVSRDQPLFDIQPLPDAIARQFAGPRAIGQLLGGFALLGLAMSAMGIYMVVAYLTSRRAREVALRRAIGASTAHVLALLAGQTMRWSIAGLAAGILGATAAAGALRAAIAGVTPLEPATVVIVSAVYLAIVVVAVGVPVSRALRIDPATLLRSE